MKTKNHRPLLESLERRECPADWHWLGGSVFGANSWGYIHNWAEGPARNAVPGEAVGDVVIFDQNSAADLHTGITRSVAAIRNNGGGDADLVISAGTTLNLAGGASDWHWEHTDPDNDRIVMRNGSTLNVLNDATLVSSNFVVVREGTGQDPVINVVNGGWVDIDHGHLEVGRVTVGVGGDRAAWFYFGAPGVILSGGQPIASNNLLMLAGSTFEVGPHGTLRLDQEENQSVAGGIVSPGAGTVDVVVTGGGRVERINAGEDNVGPLIDGKLDVTGAASVVTIGAGSALRVGGKAGDGVGARFSQGTLRLLGGSHLSALDKDVGIWAGAALEVMSETGAAVSAGVGALEFDHGVLRFLGSDATAALTVNGNVRVYDADLYFKADGFADGQCNYILCTGVFNVTGGLAEATWTNLEVVEGTPEVTYEYDVIRCPNFALNYGPDSILWVGLSGTAEGLGAAGRLTNGNKHWTIWFFLLDEEEEEGEG